MLEWFSEFIYRNGDTITTILGCMYFDVHICMANVAIPVIAAIMAAPL